VDSESAACERRVDGASTLAWGACYPGEVNDTSPAANARYHELLRAMAPERRLEAAMGLSRAVRELAVAGLRSRHPDASEDELRVRLTVRLYGREAALRLFRAVPEDAV
jgi:hypothetical protein